MNAIQVRFSDFVKHTELTLSLPRDTRFSAGAGRGTVTEAVSTGMSSTVHSRSAVKGSVRSSAKLSRAISAAPFQIAKIQQTAEEGRQPVFSAQYNKGVEGTILWSKSARRKRASCCIRPFCS